MQKELNLKTKSKAKTTPILFGCDYTFKSFLKRLIERTSKRIAIITDYNLEKLYLSKIKHFNLKIFSIEPGEVSKSRQIKQILENNLFSNNFGRDSLLIALGGGVIGDITGFLASTYCRGIPYIQVPTSLLAMVDSSIGGKTGVNTPYGKNMIGAFNPPEEVWIDTDFLKTLPVQQWTVGLVEIIKTGLIASAPLIESLKNYTSFIENQDLSFTLDLIFESVSIKQNIVEIDPEEKGLRRILNLGHTFGHALETMENYEIDHGSAVAIGILGSCYASHLLGHLSSDDFSKVWKLFDLYKIPLFFRNNHTINTWMSQLARDKKSLMGIPRIVMLKSIGKPLPFNGEYCKDLDSSIIKKTLSWMHEQFYRSSK